MAQKVKVVPTFLIHQGMKTLRASWLLSLIGIPAILMFALAEVDVLHIDPNQSFFWRSIGIIPLVLFIPLLAFRFRKNTYGLVGYHALASTFLLIMISGITYGIFMSDPQSLTVTGDDVEVLALKQKSGALTGYFLVILGVYSLAAGARKYYQWIVGVPVGTLLFLLLAFNDNMEENDWGLISNVVIGALLTIFMSMAQYRLEKNEFLLQQQLASSNQELEQHRKRLQERVKEATKELVEAKEKAEQMSSLKSTMLSNLSHELRTPAAAVMPIVDILREYNQNPELDPYIGLLHESGERLLTTLRNTILFSELESGQVQPQHELTDIHDIFHKEIQAQQARLEEKKLSLTKNFTDNTNYFYSDSQILRQIIHYLLDNAIKFTHHGGIEISCSLENDQLLVSIKDTGMGISKESLPYIFDSFRQESEGLNRKFNGVGLGLPLVHGYVGVLGGEIKVESEKGKGSCFSFWIPVMPISEEDSLPLTKQ